MRLREGLSGLFVAAMEPIWMVGVLYKVTLMCTQKGLWKPKFQLPTLQWKQLRPRSPDGLCLVFLSIPSASPPVPCSKSAFLHGLKYPSSHLYSLGWHCPTHECPRNLGLPGCQPFHLLICCREPSQCSSQSRLFLLHSFSDGGLTSSSVCAPHCRKVPFRLTPTG